MAVYPAVAARFYDVMYDRVRSGIDKDFFLHHICATQGRVLEVGVGTGRIFTEALARGVDITGIDLSNSMLQILKQRAPEAVGRVHQMDVRELALPGRFRLIVAPFRVFSHLLEIEDQLQSLNCVAAHLEDDGRFLFDLFVPDYRRLADPPCMQLEFEGEYAPGQTLRRYASVTPHPAAQTNVVTLKYEWIEQGASKTETWTFPMRYYFRYELVHLIARSDLELVDLHGDYAGGPVTDESQDFVVVCRKRGAAA